MARAKSHQRDHHAVARIPAQRDEDRQHHEDGQQKLAHRLPEARQEQRLGIGQQQGTEPDAVVGQHRHRDHDVVGQHAIHHERRLQGGARNDTGEPCVAGAHLGERRERPEQARVRRDIHVLARIQHDDRLAVRFQLAGVERGDDGLVGLPHLVAQQRRRERPRQRLPQALGAGDQVGAQVLVGAHDHRRGNDERRHQDHHAHAERDLEAVAQVPERKPWIAQPRQPPGGRHALRLSVEERRTVWKQTGHRSGISDPLHGDRGDRLT
jgi:hypothetical protein